LNLIADVNALPMGWPSQYGYAQLFERAPAR